MRKNLIFALILSMLLIPTFTYASTSYEDMGFYTFIGTDNCTTNGKFVYNQSDGWEPKTGTKNTIYSNKAKGLAFYVKRDLVAGTTYDIKITATSNIFFQAINENAIHFYDVDTDCDYSNFSGGLDSNTIALVSLSNKASTGNYVSSITIRLTATTNHLNWILFLHNYQNKNITNTNWGIKNIQYKEVDATGTNAIIENNTINNNNLINNQTQNTQDIIDNNNKNTQDLLDNQNRIAEEQKQQNQSCEYIDKNSIYLKGKYLTGTGAEASGSTSSGITDFIKINSSDTLSNINNSETGSSQYFCFYNSNKELLSCVPSTTYNSNQNITIPSNVGYARFSILGSTNKPSFKLCKNGNQALTDTFTDSSIPSGNDYFDDFNDMLPSNNTISSLITLPISLYTKVLNSINGTCSSISLGSLYNTELIMPCINLQQYLGTTLWNTLDLIMSGAFVLIIAKKMVKAFHNFTSMKEGDVINND